MTQRELKQLAEKAEQADSFYGREICSIPIAQKLPVPLRIERFLEEIKNPYCYYDKGVPVHIAFSETEPELQRKLLTLLTR